MDHDRWKEDFLCQIKERGIPTKTFADDNRYHVWGFPFYNQQEEVRTEFTEAFQGLLPL